MVSGVSPDEFPSQIKILVAGGFGVGKTTFVGAVSEITPLTTEENLTAASCGTDDLSGIENKTTTTVAFDFGRLTFATKNLVLYLFGTPGQDRFWFMWDELSRGAVGAVVLADTRRLTDCFGAIEFFENRGIKFVVAVNEFDDAFRYGIDDVRAALQVPPTVPVLSCDARNRARASNVLIALLESVIASRRTAPDPRAATRPTPPAAAPPTRPPGPPPAPSPRSVSPPAASPGPPTARTDRSTT